MIEILLGHFHPGFAAQVAATVVVMFIDRYIGKSQHIDANSILELVENKIKSAISRLKK